MGPIKEILAATVSLITALNSSDRDQKIEKVAELLNAREQLLTQLKAPYTEEEKLLGQKINELNKKLSLLLTKERNTIQKDITDLKKKKDTSEKYTNPYEALATDGIFYDKRN